MVAELVESLPSVLSLGHKRNSNTPAFLTPVLRNIVISLARLPLVNSYTRVPPLVSGHFSAETGPWAGIPDDPDWAWSDVTLPPVAWVLPVI